MRMSKKLKRILLSIMALIIAAALVVLFIVIQHHYVNSARYDDKEAVKACVTKAVEDVMPEAKVTGFGKFCESSNHKLRVVEFSYQTDEYDEYCDWRFLLPDEIFKERVYPSYGGGEELGKLEAVGQTIGSDAYVLIYGMQLKNIGAKFEIPEIGYTGEVTDKNYLDIVVVQPSDWLGSYDIQYLSE